jgi:hypothetical protein
MRAAVLLVALLLTAVEAKATFYKYRDDSGVIVITDKLENVPQKYRKQYKAVFDEDLEAKDPLRKRWAAGNEAREKREREEKKREAAEKRKPSDGKRLVITVDEQTGELIRTME